MARSEAVRQAALKRDDNRCQITGAGGREWKGVVDVAHWKRLGHGGSNDLDDIKNVITLNSELHRTWEHPAVSIPKIRIVHWDPDDLANGLIVERRSLDGDTIGEWEKYPKFELWFYKKQLVGHVQENLGNMHQIETLTGFHALTMFELRLVWDELHPDMASFDQVVSHFGWDPGDAHDLADKHIWMLDHKAEWPDGLTNRQLTEIIKRNAPMTLFDGEDEEHPTDTMQAMLSDAAGMSFTDVKNALIEKKLKPAQPFYYVVMPSWYLPVVGDTGTDTTDLRIAVVQTCNEEGMKKAIRDGDICKDIENPVVIRMGKASMNLTSVKNSLRLKDADKTRIKVIQWPIPEEDVVLFAVHSVPKDEPDA